MQGRASAEVGLGEDDELPRIGAEAEEEGPQAIVGGEQAPGAAHGGGPRGVGGAEQAQDLREHVDRENVERAQRAVLPGGLRAARGGGGGEGLRRRRPAAARASTEPHTLRSSTAIAMEEVGELAGWG